ncbi:hypothetical protein [Sphingomonas sp. NPDC092410]
MTWGSSIRSKLLDRGLKLNPPAPKDVLDNFLKNCPIVPSGFMEIYGSFDGFSERDFDRESSVSIWPIERIIQYSRLNLERYIPFGDIEFDAIILAVDLRSSGFPVIDLHEHEYKSETFVSFFNELTM